MASPSSGSILTRVRPIGLSAATTSAPPAPRPGWAISTPRTNGKAERFIQTSLREWAYARAYHSPAEVGPLRPEQPGERNGAHRLAHQRRQPLRPLAEVDRPRRHHDPDI